MPDEVPNSAVPSETSPNSNPESQIRGVSLRGLLAIAMVVTVCIMSALKVPVVEPLYTLVTVVVSFFFGHQIGSSKKIS